MDPSGLYDYGTLETGGYFGDISCLSGKPNNFSYYYNTNQDSKINVSEKNSLFLISMRSREFKEIIDKHPIAKEHFERMAKQRESMFQSYKRRVLLKYMKYIVKNPYIINNEKYKNRELNLLQRVGLLREEQIKLKIVKLLIRQFDIKRSIFKKFGENKNPSASVINQVKESRQQNETANQSILIPKEM